MTEGYPRAVLFGRALSRDYLRALMAGLPPAHKEAQNAERRMDTLAGKLAAALAEAGYHSLGKQKTGRLPHKTVALRAGLGFIGKNNLLVTPQYGCALLLGKVLTDAPFAALSQPPQPPACGDCRACVEACAPGALLGTAWTLTTTREEILTRKDCVLCLKCMLACPYTVRYAEELDPAAEEGRDDRD